MLEQALHASLPALRPSDSPLPRVTLRIAVNADSLATWFVAAAAAFAAEQPALLDIGLDDQDHTAERLRSGEVLAAVTALAEPVQGCRSLPLGRMRYLATASPAFVARHFAGGIGAGSLARAPSLVFNAKDDLQARWVRRLCHRDVELPRHTVPSAHAFVTAAAAGMGWGLQPQALIAFHLTVGSLVELVPDTALDVSLYWQHARAASSLLDGLSREVLAAAGRALLPP
jgi:LysR family transcriptional regulator (chromosome initiation inhibitor)